ncbi:MAG TPA: acyltransferase, partial [Paraburkholderia sp.]
MAMPKEIRPLTGLRGIAALYAMGFHYFIGLGFSSHFATLMSHGYLAVDLFFCLSGFVMALSYGHMFAGNWSSAAYFSFIGRRIARIYPLYLVVTVTAFLLTLCGWLATTASSGVTLALNVALNLAMVQVWGFADSFDGAAWSLSAEWAAYLIFPILLVPALRRRSSVAWLTGIVCVSIIMLLPTLRLFIGGRSAPHALLDIFEPAMGLPVLRCLAEFTLGLVAYRIAFTPFGMHFAASGWAAPIVLLTTLALMTVTDLDAAIVTMFVACLVVLSSEQNGPAKWLSCYPVQLAGRLSYS